MKFTTNIDIDSLVALKKVNTLLTSKLIDIYCEENQLDRMSMDGAYTFLGKIHSTKVAVIITDFRVFGGSFSKKNSRRVCSFIDYAYKNKIPLIFGLNSLGVRFIEGRTVFDDAFSIIANLSKFRKENLLLTLGIGNVLGISALIFAQGHYRLALKDDAEFNLTGPEVHKIFFGKTDAKFSDYSNSSNQFSTNSLIHEIFTNQENMYKATHDLIDLIFNLNSSDKTKINNHSDETEDGGFLLRHNEIENLKKIEECLGDKRIELFSQKGLIVRIYIAKIGKQNIGYLVNPPGHPNNLINVKAVEKSIAAIELFKVLKLPVVSILDSPGADPRKNESDHDAVMKMIQLVHLMIDYPYTKMGIINGRCFGGAGMFNFPKIFGGKRNYAVLGTKMGVMSKEIIDSILTNNGRLKELWETNSKTELHDLSDLVDIKTIDEIISVNEIRTSIEKTLLGDNNEPN